MRPEDAMLVGDLAHVLSLKPIADEMCDKAMHRIGDLACRMLREGTLDPQKALVLWCEFAAYRQIQGAFHNRVEKGKAVSRRVAPEMKSG